MTVSMNEAAGIYAVAAHAEVSWETVDHPLFQEFSLGITDLDKALGEYRDHDFWQDTCLQLRRIRFAITVTPLPFRDPALGVAHACAELGPRVVRANAQYSGEPAQRLAYLHELLKKVAECHDNPLGDKVLAIASETAATGLLLPNPRYQGAVTRFIDTYAADSALSVLTPRELSVHPPMTSLIVIGTSYLYRNDRHVVVSPRAFAVYLVRWAWVNDSFPDPDIFTESRRGEWARATSPTPRASRRRLDGADIVPHIDWRAIEERVGERGAARPGELVLSKVLLLTGGWAVAVSGEAGTIRVVEPDLGGAERIPDCDVDEIEVGDFVLLRSQGGGDLVVDIANQELGADAKVLRSLQREWKIALRDSVGASTRGAVARQLRALGSKHANINNLRNWMSPRSLRTGHMDDFEAIMKLIGRESETAKFWSAMDKLENAHRRAGHRIRQMLINVVADADLQRLETEGIMEFELEDKVGGSLTAYRVEEVAPELIEVSEHRVGRLVEATDLWLG